MDDAPTWACMANEVDSPAAPIQDGADAPLIYGETAVGQYPDPVFCPSCMKAFSVERSLKRHLERFPVCANRILHADVGEVTGPPVTEWISTLLDAATLHTLDTGVECRWCHREYETKSALNKHYKNSVPCNQSAKKELCRLVTASQSSAP